MRRWSVVFFIASILFFLHTWLYDNNVPTSDLKKRAKSCLHFYDK